MWHVFLSIPNRTSIMTSTGRRCTSDTYTSCVNCTWTATTIQRLPTSFSSTPICCRLNGLPLAGYCGRFHLALCFRNMEIFHGPLTYTTVPQLVVLLDVVDRNSSCCDGGSSRGGSGGICSTTITQFVSVLFPWTALQQVPFSPTITLSFYYYDYWI